MSCITKSIEATIEELQAIAENPTCLPNIKEKADEYIEALEELQANLPKRYRIILTPDYKLEYVAEYDTSDDFIESSDTRNEIIGENLRIWREYNNMTQQEVGDAIGYSRQAYQKYEMGTRGVPVDLLPALAKLFNADLEQLIYPPRELRNTPQYKPYENIDKHIHVVEVHDTDRGMAIVRRETSAKKRINYKQLQYMLDGQFGWHPMGYTVADNGDYVLVILYTNQFDKENLETLRACEKSEDRFQLKQFPSRRRCKPYQVGGRLPQTIRLQKPYRDELLAAAKSFIKDTVKKRMKVSEIQEIKKKKRKESLTRIMKNMNAPRTVRIQAREYMDFLEEAQSIAHMESHIILTYNLKFSQVLELMRHNRTKDMPCIDFKIVGHNLKKWREYRHKSPETISTIVGYSADDYLKYESGEVNAPLDVVAKLAKYFNTSIENLIYRCREFRQLPQYKANSALDKRIHIVEIRDSDENRVIVRRKLNEDGEMTYKELYDILDGQSDWIPLGYAITNDNEAVLAVMRAKCPKTKEGNELMAQLIQESKEDRQTIAELPFDTALGLYDPSKRLPQIIYITRLRDTSMSRRMEHFIELVQNTYGS